VADTSTPQDSVPSQWFTGAPQKFRAGKIPTLGYE